jgi:myo-inositol catabolism protein IolC
MESTHLPQEQKAKLRAQYQPLNPFELKDQIEQKLKLLFDRARAR